jgi:UDP-N-acetylmuramoylalanine--D-glutamate ligase
VTVAGAARSGMAASELLARRGARVTLSEVRTDVAGTDTLTALGVALELGGHRTETFTNADLVVTSPGVPPDQPAIAAARTRGVPIIGELELASRWLRGRIVAITGTKGKSTTTELTGRILEAAGFKVTVGGNIGSPLSAQVTDSTPETVHVVEASSFQLEQIDTFHPWIAVLLNFSADHLDRHPTVEAYGAAKARVFENQAADDWAVINADDPSVLELARKGRARTWLFGRRAPISRGTVVEDGWIIDRRPDGPVRLVPLDAIHLLGPHLVSDVMAAATVGAIAGAAPPAMTAAVESFHGLEHAMELVAEIDGVRFVNDSKATNTAAARRALAAYDVPLRLVLGGSPKGEPFDELAREVRGRAASVYLIGEAADELASSLDRAGVAYERSGTLEQAVRSAAAAARPGDVVLLSPACASYDQYENFERRGEDFRRIVRTLEG